MLRNFFPTNFIFFLLQKHWETIGEVYFSNVNLTNFSFKKISPNFIDQKFEKIKGGKEKKKNPLRLMVM
jgi:hypothetical protein